MAINKDKVVAAAQRFIQKGQLDKAIAEYLRIVEEQPSDVRTWLKIGDLHAKRGARVEATQTYLKVADFYSAQGFYLKAVAVYKQILKLDPSLTDVNVKLAELYQQLGLLSDALGQYELVAAHLMRLGRNREALATLRRMVELDPENVASRIKLAEGFSKEGMVEEAAEEFARACLSLREQGRREDFVRVAERLLYHRPNDVDIARELAQIYLGQNDTKRALAKLHICVKADPRDIPTLELLAEAFRLLGQTAKTVSVLREVARIHGDAGRADDKMRVIHRIADLDPADTEVARLRGEQKKAVPPPPAAKSPPPGLRPPPPTPTGPAADILRKAVVAPVGRIATPLEEAGRVAVPLDQTPLPAEEAAPRPRAADRSRAAAEVRRILTETEVFMKYGLRQKAIEHLQRCFEIDPLDPVPRERLKDLYVQGGQRDEAVAVLYSLADVVGDGGDAAAAAKYLDEILRLDPNQRAARDRILSLRGDVARRAATAEPVTARTAMPEEDPFAEDGIDSAAFEEPMVDLSSEVGPVPSPDFEDDFPSETTSEEVLVDLASDSQVGEAPRRPSAAATARPAPTASPQADEELPPVLQTRREVSPPPDNVIPFPTAKTRDLPADLRPAKEAGPGAAGVDVEESLEEADFFIAQGLHEEARALIEDLLRSHPGHRVLLDRLAELDEMAGGGEPTTDQSFALAERLADELGEPEPAEPADMVNVDQVFEQFKKGVEQQVSADDWATHMDLGIAYKEMGLLDDAIAEFRLAMTNPAKAAQCHMFIGLCNMAKGAWAEAIAAFKRGLYVDPKSDQEELGLYYELGNAHEKQGDVKEAVYYFQKVVKRDPNFRGVGERIAALGGGRASGPGDEVDQAFDDLMKSSKK